MTTITIITTPIIVFVNQPPILPSKVPQAARMDCRRSLTMKSSTMNAPIKAPINAPITEPIPRKNGTPNIAPIIPNMNEPAIVKLLALLFFAATIPIINSIISPRRANDSKMVKEVICILLNSPDHASSNEKASITQLPGKPQKWLKIAAVEKSRKITRARVSMFDLGNYSYCPCDDFLFLQYITKELATNIEEYVPTITPTIKVNAKSCMTAPPKKKSGISTIKTVTPVSIVLERVWVIPSFTRSPKFFDSDLAIFSLILSKMTMVSFTE